MRKYGLWRKIFLCFLICVLLCGCAPVLHGQKELEEKLRAELPMPDAAEVPVQYLGMAGEGEKVFICYAVGSESTSRSYYAMECAAAGGKESAWRFVKLYESRKRAEDIGVFMWQSGYVFAVGNTACETVLITDSTASRHCFTRSEKSQEFWLLYFPAPLETYEFLNAQGEAIG